MFSSYIKTNVKVLPQIQLNTLSSRLVVCSN